MSCTGNLDILFVSVNSGTGLFGRQKRSIVSYLGSFEEDTFEPGITFKKLLVALTSINNIYRGAPAY